jgi:DNA-binding LacI/PurR family transcriptional regulator
MRAELNLINSRCKKIACVLGAKRMSTYRKRYADYIQAILDKISSLGWPSKLLKKLHEWSRCIPKECDRAC